MQTPNSPEKDELEAVRLSEFDRTIGIAGEVMFIDTKKRVTLSNSSPNNMINHYVNGDGVWLFDQEGRKYLDCCNNSASVGHHHPAINKAMYEQAHRHIAHQHYLNESAAIYAENLANNLPEQLETFFFSISETEARELAISIATSVTQKTGIIVIERDICKNLDFKSTTPLKILAVEPHNRYHTSTTHSVGATERHVTMIDKAIGTLNDEGSGVAAFFCDAIFTSDGYLELPTNYFQQAYASIRRVGGLCIADEVRAGLGRTGKMWGFEQYNVVPDIVVVGQLNESGLPIGIVVTTAAIAEKFEQRGGYVRKFVNNSISAAIGNATLEVILSQRAIENVQIVSRYLRGELQSLASRHPLMGSIRGTGFFFDIELVSEHHTKTPASQEAANVVTMMREEGVLIQLTGRFSNVLALRLPLFFSKDNCDFMTEKLHKIMDRLAQNN